MSMRAGATKIPYSCGEGDGLLKTELDRLYREFDASWLDLDPLGLVRPYTDPEDREIAGFIASALAIGQYDLIRKAVREILEMMGPSPYEFVRRFESRRSGGIFDGFVYRFYRGRDIGLLLSWTGAVVRSHGSLLNLFLKGFHPDDADIGSALSRFVRSLLAMDPSPFYARPPARGTGIRHFLADPADGSACKRLNLFLRWMVRRDSPDLGIWRSIPPSRLIMPVDTHIARLAPLIGLTSRKSADWRMAVGITEALRRLDPGDPVKYDFALCTIGKRTACPDDPGKSACGSCPLIGLCLKGSRQDANFPGGPALRQEGDEPHGANQRTMQVKGTAVLALNGFIREKFPARYDEWVQSLPPEGRKTHRNSILAFENYLIYDAVVVPTEKACEMFYGGDDRGSWDSGVFSASFALNSFYKVFFRLGSPQFIIKRASRVFSSYYPEGEISVAESSDRRVVLHIVKFKEPYHIVEVGIGGWMEGALRLMKCENISVTITKSMAKGAPVTEFVATWG